MANQEMIKVRKGLSTEVASKAKTLAAARTALQRVGEKAKQELAKAKAAFDAAHAEHASAEDTHKKFEAFLTSTGTPAVPTKPGPKAAQKASTKAVVKAAPKASKPGPKAKVKAASKSNGKAAAKAAAPKKAAVKAAPKKALKAAPKGDGKKGKTMVQRMIDIIGSKDLSAGEIEAGLIKQGNPPSSKNLKGYISSVLSGTVDKDGAKVFEAVERGRYCVVANKKGGTAKAPSAKKEPTTKAAAAAPAAATPEPTPVAESTGTPADAMMAELGLEDFAGGGGAGAEQNAPLA